MTRRGEVWMMHKSVNSWTDIEEWDGYLRSVESVLSDRLAKLDVRDPARRKADTISGEGRFVTQFGRQEASRWLLGRFKESKVEVQIQLYRDGRDSFLRRRDNSIAFYISERARLGIGMRRLVELFDMTNAKLGTFYAFADLRDVYCAKKASPPSLGALNIASELPGVFWLTYFGPHYCEFLGRDRLAALAQASQGPAGGVTLRLAESPEETTEDVRRLLERELGAETFAGTGEVTMEKPEGQFALTLDELSSDTAGHFSTRRKV